MFTRTIQALLGPYNWRKKIIEAHTKSTCQCGDDKSQKKETLLQRIKREEKADNRKDKCDFEADDDDEEVEIEEAEEKPPPVHLIAISDEPKVPPKWCPKELEHDAFTIPKYINAAVFRRFNSPDEELGPNAGKKEKYKNPEYYGYHRMSYFELKANTSQLICIKNEEYEAEKNKPKPKPPPPGPTVCSKELL